MRNQTFRRLGLTPPPGIKFTTDHKNKNLVAVEIPIDAVPYVSKKLARDFAQVNYGFKGGAAREILLWALGMIDHSEIKPRDLDLIRLSNQFNVENSITSLDNKLAGMLSPEDVTFGYGVEEIDSIENLLGKTDFTVNEVCLMFRDDGVKKSATLYLSKDCLFDTIDGVIRLSQYELDRFDFSSYGDVNQSFKLLAKTVRLQLTFTERHGNEWRLSEQLNTAINDAVEDPELHRAFWIRLNLEKIAEAKPTLLPVLIKQYQTVLGVDIMDVLERQGDEMEPHIKSECKKAAGFNDFDETLLDGADPYDKYSVLPTQEPMWWG